MFFQELSKFSRDDWFLTIGYKSTDDKMTSHGTHGIENLVLQEELVCLVCTFATNY